jgi:glutaconate CoA-transferase subunit A
MAVIATPAQAAAEIADGACIVVGGSINAGHPMAVIRALIRAGRRDLTIAGLTNGLELDLLVAAGCARVLSAAYVGAEEIVGLPPAIRWAAEEDRLDVWECDEGIHLAMLRARALKLPYATWSGTLGTAPTTHPYVEEAVDEPTGKHYLKVRPLTVDAGLVWAEAADEDGNLLLWGPDMGDEWVRNAADLRIAQVERIVPTAVLSQHPDRVMPWAAEIVVRAPLSTHPFGSTALAVDDLWLKAYAGAVSSARKAGDPDQLRAFIAEWILALDDEAAYLEKVGVQRLLELMV